MDTQNPLSQDLTVHRSPNASERLNGFPAGPLDRDLWNYLFYGLMSEIGNVVTAGGLNSTDDAHTWLRDSIQTLIQNDIDQLITSGELTPRTDEEIQNVAITAGFKRMKETRLFNDSNPVFAYPGGTSMADATVTHSFTYVSAFPDEETDIFMNWSCKTRLNQNSTNNAPRGYGAVTLLDGTVITNICTVGVEIVGGDTDGYVETVLAASGFVTKQANESQITLQQRCYMTGGLTAHTMELDNADIVIREYVK